MAPNVMTSIIGADDRRELHQVTSEPLRRVARATAVMIGTRVNFLERTGDGYRLTSSVKTHAEADGLCSDEPYANQPAPGDCTSFLMGSDLLVTAAHCVSNDCKKFHYVFDFASTAPGEVRRTFRADQVFSCKKIVASNADQDWAIVRLDRPVPGREPLRIRESGEPAVGNAMAVVGFPRGLPLKIAAGARVMAAGEFGFADPATYFEADLDVFGGNSGSPVVSPDTGTVEGILAVGFGETEAGFTDPRTGRPCKRLRRMAPADATNPWIVRASTFRAALRRATGQR